MIMWTIQEHRRVPKSMRYLPAWIVKEYEVWKDLVRRNGPEILRQYPGYHDELLKGERAGQRSSRLSQQYRVLSVRLTERSLWFMSWKLRRTTIRRLP
jgi:proteic killer suppression protein